MILWLESESKKGMTIFVLALAFTKTFEVDDDYLDSSLLLIFEKRADDSSGFSELIILLSKFYWAIIDVSTR